MLALYGSTVHPRLFTCFVWLYCASLGVPYSGKLSREKTFTNFAIFQPSISESFLHEILGMPHPLCDQLIFRKNFLREMLLSYVPIRESFLPRKFPAIRYYVIFWTIFFCLVCMLALSRKKIK